MGKGLDMFNQILKEIDVEVERCETMIDTMIDTPVSENIMDRIQGILWVRNLIHKHMTQPAFDVEEYYKEE